MKIIFVLQSITRIGGTEKATLDQANYLAENTDYEIIIFSIYKNVSPLFSVNRELSSKIKVFYFFDNICLLKFDDLLYRILELILRKKINNAIQSLNPDYIIYTSIKLFIKSNIKSILMVHFSYNHFLTGRLTRNFFYKYYEFFHKIIFLSNEDLIEYEKYFKKNNGVYIPNFCQLQPKIRTNYKNKIISFVGRLDNHQKQVDQLIEIIYEINKRNVLDGWKINLYGSGPDYKQILESIKRYNLEDIIILKGLESDLEKIYSTTDLIVLTSKFEGLPLCLIEASLSGIPIISYKCAPGISMIVKDNINGFIIEQNNREAFANAIIYFIENHKELHNFGTRGLIYSKQFFSSENILQKWLKLF